MDGPDNEDAYVTELTRYGLGVVLAVCFLIGGAWAELRHGDQAVTVTDTPRGTVNVRTIPVERSEGNWVMGAQVGRAREGDLFNSVT